MSVDTGTVLLVNMSEQPLPVFQLGQVNGAIVVVQAGNALRITADDAASFNGANTSSGVFALQDDTPENIATVTNGGGQVLDYPWTVIQ